MISGFRMPLEAGGLKLAYTSELGAAYTIGGQFPCASADDPLLVASRSLPGTVPGWALDDIEAFTDGLLEGREGFAFISIHERSTVEIDGLAGYRAIAAARDGKTNRPVMLYQVVLFEPADRPRDRLYYLIFGTIGADLAQTYLKPFDALARAFRREPTPAAEGNP